jgi:co-chaperonin GroES (HSP10)
MGYRPLGDRLFIQPDPVVTETAGGLTLVEDWPQETSGTVVSLGSSVPDIRVGERVLFAPSAGQVVEINQERLFILRARDVVAVVTHE